MLAKKIRAEDEIKGILLGNKAFKLKAFADDLVITTENRMVCIPRVLEIIDEFGQVAGFKLNKNKTKLLVNNMSEQNKKITKSY